MTVNITTTALWERQPEARITLNKALELFDAAYRARNLSPRTVQWHRERLGHFFRFLEHGRQGEPILADFTAAAFRMFILEKQAGKKYLDHRFKRPTDDKPSSAYIHSFFRAVRGFASWLFYEGLLPVNITAGLKLPKHDERELQPLTPAEEQKLLNAYSETRPGECRDKGIFMLLLSTGIRRAELLGLKDSAVNLEEGFITVWGKGKEQRSIPFGFKTAWVLQCYRLLVRPEPATPAIDTFFLSKDGYPMTRRELEMVFRRARERSGVSRVHAHLLRHTYGTRSTELGIPTLTLQRFMGHSQPTVTERYVHTAPANGSSESAAMTTWTASI